MIEFVTHAAMAVTALMLFLVGRYDYLVGRYDYAMRKWCWLGSASSLVGASMWFLK